MSVTDFFLIVQRAFPEFDPTLIEDTEVAEDEAADKLELR